MGGDVGMEIGGEATVVFGQVRILGELGLRVEDGRCAEVFDGFVAQGCRPSQLEEEGVGQPFGQRFEPARFDFFFAVDEELEVVSADGVGPR